ncbi:hypothetical protein ACRRS0_01850 [Agarivorans sp. QJM3NY_29]
MTVVLSLSLIYVWLTDFALDISKVPYPSVAVGLPDFIGYCKK